MEMYKNPRSESNIIHRPQRLGLRETMRYTDESYQLMKQDRSITVLVSDDGERSHYYGPEDIATHEDTELNGEEWYKQLLQAIYLPVTKPGMLVAYEPGYKVEPGKVRHLSKDGTKAFAWYHGGDTAACTSVEDLYPIGKNFVLQHRDMFENAYLIDDVIAKESEGEQ